MARDANETNGTDDAVERDEGETGGKLREIFGTGSLTGGAGSSGVAAGAGDRIISGDVMTGGDDGVDTTGAGPVNEPEKDPDAQ